MPIHGMSLLETVELVGLVTIFGATACAAFGAALGALRILAVGTLGLVIGGLLAPLMPLEPSIGAVALLPSVAGAFLALATVLGIELVAKLVRNQPTGRTIPIRCGDGFRNGTNAHAR